MAFRGNRSGRCAEEKLMYWEELWDWPYRKLKEYRDEHGDCDVPKSQGPLGNWVTKQRHNYKNEMLSQERVDLLEGWEPFDEAWTARFVR